MHLAELIPTLQAETDSGAPGWLVGAFRRRSISFANGQSDISTRVYWLQTRTLTFDLRLPREGEQTPWPSEPPHAEQSAEIEALMELEGWYAHSHWDGRQLDWRGGDSLQLHNRWPEPALLRRVGNSMIEFAPSGAYVEDWRLLNDKPGPLLGLELISETCLDTREKTARRGALILCGNYAGLVLGHPGKPPQPLTRGVTLQGVLEDVEAGAAQRQWLLELDVSLAKGTLKNGFTVTDAIRADRVGQPLCSLDGFEQGPQTGQVRQRLLVEGRRVERVFRVETAQAQCGFELATPATRDSQRWFQRESATLERYTETLK